MRVIVESSAAYDYIVIQYPQCTEMYFFSIMPIPKAKGMVAIEPAEIDMASF